MHHKKFGEIPTVAQLRSIHISNRHARLQVDGRIYTHARMWGASNQNLWQPCRACMHAYDLPCLSHQVLYSITQVKHWLLY